MPYHDLNLHCDSSSSSSALSHNLAFASELGYSAVALSTSITGKLPATLPTIPTSTLTIPRGLTLLNRVTLTVSDTSQNHRLVSLQSAYDLLALRPTTEKALQSCCSTLQCDIISIDFSQRLPFILKFKTVSSALQRGIKFEINYSAGISGGSDARRNVIAGATALIRATRGRGIILSSEARNALGLRGPHDAINLACIWGLSQERGKEAICEEADKVIRLAKLRRDTYRGVVAVVDDGQSKPESVQASVPLPHLATTQPTSSKNREGQGTPPSTDLKRKASTTSLSLNNSNPALPTSSSTKTQAPGETMIEADDKPLSKREQKRRAKKARLETNNPSSNPKQGSNQGGAGDSSLPIKHETLSSGRLTTTNSKSKEGEKKA